MTPNQKNILVKLVVGNLIVYVVLAYWFLGLPVPQISELVALIPTLAPKPTPTLIKVTTTVTRLPTLEPTPTQKPLPTSRVIRPTAKPGVQQAVPQAPSGTSPSSPMLPGDAWQTLGAGAQVWYRIGYGGVHMDVLLEAKPLEGVTMDVFAPNQLGQPIGRGTFQKALGGLVWAGGHWNADGSWLARIHNSNPASVQYKLSSNSKDISNKTCESYWEHIGTAPVYWTVCE
ncbi:MAG: hypothetical protein HZB51_07915 [Chloroflexi bacterium]|nr:hypothetical protein [Chloroflexota bacterium]